MKRFIKIYCGVPALLIVSFVFVVVIPAMIDGITIGLGTLVFQYGVTFLAGILIDMIIFLARKFSKRYYPPKNSFGRWRMWVISAGIMGAAITILYLLHTLVWLSAAADMRFLLLTGPGVCLIGGTGMYLAQTAMKPIYKKIGRQEAVKWMVCTAGFGLACFLGMVLGSLLRPDRTQTALEYFLSLDLTITVSIFSLLAGTVTYFVLRNEEKKRNRAKKHE